jgi:hypothetical protein
MIFSSSSKTRFYVVIFLVLSGTITSLYTKENKLKTESNTTPLSPWIKPRQLSSFQSLLQHSPFSLATAEESSPLAERYAVTGIITLDGEEEIFVLDKNDQSRELITKKPNKKSMSLVNIVKETDPNKLKATILVNGETGVITSPEPTINTSTMGPQHFNGPGAPNSGSNPQKNTFHPSGAPYYPGQILPNAPHSPGAMPSPNNPNNHRVITRPPISGQTTQAPNNFYQ